VAYNLSDFNYAVAWARCNAASSAIQFFIKDGAGNESFWNITTNGTANTWEKTTLNLNSPDANSGTAADLADIVSFGYLGLDANVTYLFDEISLFVWDMKIYVEPAIVSNYYSQIYFGLTPIRFGGGFTGTITAPAANPRIDLVAINSGSLVVRAGAEVAAPDDDDIPALESGDIPVCAIYIPTTATKIVEYHLKDAYPNDGYIYKDLRPLMMMQGETTSTTRGTFTNSSLSGGKLTITHSLGLSAPYSLPIFIYDNNGKMIIPDEVSGSADSVEIDLTSYGTLTGTWGYVYIN
jgi:hypothetical protein